MKSCSLIATAFQFCKMKSVLKIGLHDSVNAYNTTRTIHLKMINLKNFMYIFTIKKSLFYTERINQQLHYKQKEKLE